MKRTTNRPRASSIGAVLLAASAVAGFAGCSDAPKDVIHAVDSGGTSAAPSPTSRSGPLTYERMDGPPRTVAVDAGGTVVATFTDGARTVVFEGPERTFQEPSTTDAVVSTTAWVRVAPHAWTEGAEKKAWFKQWFRATATSTEPDVFATAFQYVDGAPAQRNDDGLRFRGDASFGPPGSNGVSRLEANDFYDYLGVSWRFADTRLERPERRRYGSLDCSGFVRMVLGYRLGYPLLGSNKAGPGLPRRAYAIAASGPGVAVVPDTGGTATQYDALQPGDLVFFQTEGDQQIDHTGIYLGLDSTGHHRFISSREKANGPTMGDVGGTSVLDDQRFYSRGWRAARRV